MKFCGGIAVPSCLTVASGASKDRPVPWPGWWEAIKDDVFGPFDEVTRLAAV